MFFVSSFFHFKVDDVLHVRQTNPKLNSMTVGELRVSNPQIKLNVIAITAQGAGVISKRATFGFSPPVVPVNRALIDGTVN